MRKNTWLACLLPFVLFDIAAGFVLSIGVTSFAEIGPVMIVVGLVLLVPSLIGLRNERLNSRDKRKVLRIIRVQSSATVTDIMQETALDRELVVKTIKDAILYHQVYGALDNEETFVRDLSARPKEIEDERIGLNQTSLFGD